MGSYVVNLKAVDWSSEISWLRQNRTISLKMVGHLAYAT